MPALQDGLDFRILGRFTGFNCRYEIAVYRVAFVAYRLLLRLAVTSPALNRLVDRIRAVLQPRRTLVFFLFFFVKCFKKPLLVHVYFSYEMHDRTVHSAD